MTATATRLMDAPLGSPSRPSWRGRLHLFAVCAALPLLVLLAVRAGGARARGGVIVYAAGLTTMFLVSTTYHRWVHTVRARAAWRRADHAAIFAAITGTFTAVGLVSVSTGPAVALLVVLWAAAVAGAIVKLAAVRHADRIGVVMYIATGWAGLVLLPALWDKAGPVPVTLLVGGGILYTCGAIGFGLRWPTLRPGTFGYHEVWHAFTIAAAGMHLAAVWTVTS